MSTTHFQRLKNTGSLHTPLMLSVAMHLCAFSMIFFWNPEVPMIVHKNPVIKIQVTLLEKPLKKPAPIETPQKTPSASVARKPALTYASKAPAVKKVSALSQPAVPQSVPVPARHTAPRRTQSFALKPSFDIKSFSENISGSYAKLISSNTFSKPVARVSPLKTTMAVRPAASRSVSFSTPPKDNFRSPQRAARHPVKPSPAKILLSASASSTIHAVAAPAKFNSKNPKPVNIQFYNSLTGEGTRPASSAQASFKTTYRSPIITPLKMASLSDLIPKSSSQSTQEGTGNDDELRRGYTHQIRHRIAQKKFYPDVARRRGFEGQPVVAFILNKDGSLAHLTLDTASDHKILDRAALKAVKKGAPFPEIPEQLNLEKFRFKLSISFALE